MSSLVEAQKLRRLLKALLNFAFPTYETFALTDRLYFRIAGEEFELMNFGAGGSELIQSMKFSVVDAEQLFKSMKQACVHFEIVEVKVTDCDWIIDATRKSNRNDTIILKIKGSLGRVRAIAKRADVLEAVKKFDTRYGLSASA